MYNDITDSVLENYKKAKEQLKKDGSIALGRLFVRFFNDMPDLEEVKFKGYTSYFNDGDPCNYHLTELVFCFDGFTDDDEYSERFLYDEPSEWIREKYPSDKHLLAYDAKVKQIGLEEMTRRGNIVTSFRKAFSQLPAEMFKSAFDDHKSFSYTREKGFVVEDFKKHE